MTCAIRTAHAIGAVLLFASAALTQSPATGSITGRVLSEEGRALHASVSLSFADPRGYPAPPRRMFTSSDGGFAFFRLPAAKYVLCAQVMPSEPAPANSPFVDTCVWGLGHPPITLAAGQQVAGLVFTAPKGAWLKVRVADPDRVLPAAAARNPAAMDPQTQVIVKGPDGLYRHARLVSEDNGGRDYQIAIPLKTALSLKVASSVGDVFDQGARKLKDTDEWQMQPTTVAEVVPLTLTLHQKGH